MLVNLNKPGGYPQNNSLTIIDSIAYALPCAGIIFLQAPIGILQGIYAKNFGLALSSIAFVILISRVFDAITDPFIGYYADRYFVRKGTRKPFIIVGAVLLLVAGYFLYSPHEETTIIYFGVWLMLFYFAYTLFEIPHISWGSELANETHEKTKLFGFRTAMSYIGLVLFFSIPLLPFFETTDITPETLRLCAILGIFLIVPAVIFSLCRVPDRQVIRNNIKSGNTDHVSVFNGHDSVASIFRSLFRNRPMLIFLIGYIFYGISVGLWGGLIFTYVDSYLDLGDKFAQMFLVAFLLSIAVTPIWCRLADRFGKKNVWIVALLFVFVSFCYTGFLKPNNVIVFELMILKIINTLGYVCVAIVAPSVLSDIVDYGDWKSGVSRPGIYFSTYMFLLKSLYAVGGAFGLLIAGVYGFDATTTIQTADAVFGMLLAVSYLPMVTISLSLCCIFMLPITARRHAILRRRIDSRSTAVMCNDLQRCAS